MANNTRTPIQENVLKPKTPASSLRQVFRTTVPTTVTYPSAAMQVALDVMGFPTVICPQEPVQGGQIVVTNVKMQIFANGRVIFEADAMTDLAYFDI